MGVLTTAVEAIKNAGADFSTLTVTTYSGDLSVLLKLDGADPVKLNKLDLDNIIQYAISEANVGADAKINLMAMNVHKVDGDGIIFRADDITPALEGVHNSAVQTGRETREAILSLVKGVL